MAATHGGRSSARTVIRTEDRIMTRIATVLRSPPRHRHRGRLRTVGGLARDAGRAFRDRRAVARGPVRRRDAGPVEPGAEHHARAVRLVIARRVRLADRRSDAAPDRHPRAGRCRHDRRPRLLRPRQLHRQRGPRPGPARGPADEGRRDRRHARAAGRPGRARAGRPPRHVHGDPRRHDPARDLDRRRHRHRQPVAASSSPAAAARRCRRASPRSCTRSPSSRP